MIKFLVTVLTISSLFLSTKLWECNRCHQQYQGNNPPRTVKCPATNNKQNHWWILKRTDNVSE